MGGDLVSQSGHAVSWRFLRCSGLRSDFPVECCSEFIQLSLRIRQECPELEDERATQDSRQSFVCIRRSALQQERKRQDLYDLPSLITVIGQMSGSLSVIRLFSVPYPHCDQESLLSTH